MMITFYEITKPLQIKKIFSIREKYLEGINSSGEDKRLERVLDYDPDKKRTTQEFVNTLSPMVSRQIIQNLIKLNHGNDITRSHKKFIKF
ncbi:unnamed protein product [Rhizophagus irregularis]|nr:unnamed protein product [Rhizophagus irregularis]